MIPHWEDNVLFLGVVKDEHRGYRAHFSLPGQTGLTKVIGNDDEKALRHWLEVQTLKWLRDAAPLADQNVLFPFQTSE